MSAYALPGVDVSIVLNLHDEASYLGRTLTSLLEAVQYARTSKKRFELIAVLDRPTPATQRLIQAADLSAFDRIAIVEVDNGSLGLSRNDGVNAATGTYVCTADGDDLVSFNFFSECLATIEVNPESVVLPEFLYSFGTSYYLSQYFGSDRIPGMALASFHPYLSRIFVSRTFFDRHRYTEIPRNPHFAYEDWHLNCQAAAHGSEFKVAPNTLLFYRQRSGSIMMTEGNHKVVPYSPYFSRQAFLENFRDDYRKKIDGQEPPRLESELVRQYTLQSRVISELLSAANRIEPGVDYDHLLHMGFGSPAGDSLRRALDFGTAYYEALCAVDAAPFTDILLVPFLSGSDIESYLLNVMGGLRTLDSGRKILILGGEEPGQHARTNELPANLVFVDLWSIAHDHGVHDTLELTLRMIQACAPTANIHVHDCDYARRIMQRYQGALSSNRFIYYFFSAAKLRHNGAFFTPGSSYNFLSEALRSLSLIVFDHRASMNAVTEAFELEDNRTTVLYPKADFDPCLSPLPRARGGTALRLLWASRLDSGERPDVVVKIARNAHARGLAVTIDMYGSPMPQRFQASNINLPNVQWRGDLNDFSSLPLQQFDALLHTSASDGLLNVVLAATAHGLPVIAVDVGGISELICADTGVLVPDNANDDTLADSYLDALRCIIHGEVDLDARTTHASGLSKSRHSQDAYLRQLARIFGLPEPAST